MQEFIEVNEKHPITDTSGKSIMLAEDGQVVKAPDLVAEAVKKNWSDIGFLYECLENFLKAIQLKAKKDYHYSNVAEFVAAGSPVWNKKDSFYRWMADVDDQLQFRLDELIRKHQQHSISDKQLLHLLDDGSIENKHPYLAKTMTTEDFEMFEFILRKSIEATKKFREGKYTMDDVRRGQPRAN